MFDEILRNKLPADKAALVVKALFLFVVLAGGLAVATAPSLSSDEAIFLKAVKDFVAQPDIKADELGLYKVKTYLFSLPFRLAGGLGQPGRLAVMRTMGLIFFILTLWLAYQTARRLTPNNDFISLAVLGLLATNNQLLFSAVAIGGDSWLFFFFAFLVYELVEIAAKGSVADVFISLALIFILSRMEPLLAEKVVLPILFLVMVLTILTANKDRLAEILPRSAPGKAAIAAVLFALFVLAQRASLPAMLLSAPMAVVVSLARLFAWPAVIRQLVVFFSANSNLAEGFSWAQAILTAVFQITALAGAAGIVWLFYRGAAQYVRVTKEETILAPAAAGGSGGWQVAFVEPQKSVWEGFTLPGLAAMALLPLTAFAANNASVIAGLLSDAAVYILTIPLTLLLAIGLRQLALAGQQAAGAVAYLLATLLTVNVASFLLTVLWR